MSDQVTPGHVTPAEVKFRNRHGENKRPEVRNTPAASDRSRRFVPTGRSQTRKQASCSPLVPVFMLC